MPEAAVPVVIPEALWEPEAGEEAVLVGWLADEGAAVRQGERLAEIMVDKVTLDVEAPASGRLAIHTPVDAEVRPGAVIATIHP